MKIVLAALNAKYVHSNLAVYDMEAYAKEQMKKEAWEGEAPNLLVREYTINHNLDVILQSVYQEKAAVVAFSCYIWNIYEILTIAKELHKVAPDVRIWLGGPEVSYDSRKVLKENPFVEGIVCGEGEKTFYELVRAWCREEDCARKKYEPIQGIIYRNDMGEICKNATRSLMDLSEVPFVYQDLSRFENRILYYETSRGCPFSCSYCLSSIDKSVRFRDMELVEKELQFFLDNRVPQVKFIDRTFNCKKEHAMAIWRYITEHDNGVTNFHFEVSADLIGAEELALFETMRPGLIQLEIGLQSTNPETIREIRRSMNIARLKENMLAIRAFGNIHQHLDLIAGLPYENFESFQTSFNEAYDMKPNQLQLGFLKVLKGSYMEEQIKAYGLQYQDFQPYEVLCTKWLSYDEILQLKLVEEMVEVYYNSDQYEHVLAYIVPLFDSPFAFYEALGNYYKVHDLFGIGFKREARYEVLKNFCEECLGDKVSKEILMSLLTYDYYLRENAKSRPAWNRNEPIEKTIYHQFFKNGGTDEVRLDKEGYDSKVAARVMHIEPISVDAIRFLIEDEEAVNPFCESCRRVYCLFDYDKRNPLSKDADVMLLSHL